MINSIALALFVATAAIGTTLARTARRGPRASPLMLISHGLLAMSGLLALILSVAPSYGSEDTGYPGLALGLFLLTAGLGVSMFRTREPGTALRLQPLVAHIALSIAGIALLAAAVAGMTR